MAAGNIEGQVHIRATGDCIYIYALDGQTPDGSNGQKHARYPGPVAENPHERRWLFGVCRRSGWGDKRMYSILAGI